jgi:hypothetical protein
MPRADKLAAMKKIDSMALAGLVIGVVIAVGAYMKVLNTERTVTELVTRCEKANDDLATRPAVAHEPWLNDPYVCDPSTLSSLVTLSEKNVGIQRQIVVAQSKVYDPSMPYTVAAIIAMMACTPWTWYFFLRRLSELASAVSGR